MAKSGGHKKRSQEARGRSCLIDTSEGGQEQCLSHGRQRGHGRAQVPENKASFMFGGGVGTGGAETRLLVVETYKTS